MKLRLGRSAHLVFFAVACLDLMVAVAAFASPAASNVANAHKVKIKGVILVREGDLVKVENQKDGSIQTIAVTDETKIQRVKGTKPFAGHKRAVLTMLVPGMTVRVEGFRNSGGQIEAETVRFSPDAFAIAVAEEQQILDNQASTKQARESANEGIANAAVAQSAAEQAQSTANRGVSSALAAGTLAVADAVEVSMLNQSVSDLGEYETVARLGVYFPENGRGLDASSKASLDELASVFSNISGYLIEISGYASSTGGAQYNQRLSEQRAAVVAQYLREQDNVPAWRIVVPAGYGATHPGADNSDPDGCAWNPCVEVRILVSKGAQESSEISGAGYHLSR